MFQKLNRTTHIPNSKPILIWDGACGFCKFWVTRWKFATGDAVYYTTFQESAHNFPDIPLKEFKKASRFIDLDGFIYSGPDSAYKLYESIPSKDYPFHRWYIKYSAFRWLSDHAYNFIAKNRPMVFRWVKILFGSNPTNLKPYWLLYIFCILLFVFVLFQ
ncbi:thiol-disulfide oxidoreductase DCC family protein [Leeuwenhoekiella sp. W20_SRS_FM14]|uniref:thiol-disulfide oxidoreductase DCC family protein n=1 Tax=Leeuwenhoekiella sp. W20_SRS_FM14 TaxID=3240270 RepID=UPI003F998669